MSAFLENTVLFGVHGIFGRWLGVEENHGGSKVIAWVDNLHTKVYSNDFQ